MRALITLLMLVALFVGCGTMSRLRGPKLPGSSAQKSNLTPGMVKSKVHIGETTQAEVLQVFGAPNIVTRDKSGREVWTYDVQSVSQSSASAQRSGSAGIAAAGIADPAIIAGGAGGSASKSGAVGQVSSSTFTLMIIFDDQDVVQDYKMMSTQF